MKMVRLMKTKLSSSAPSQLDTECLVVVALDRGSKDKPEANVETSDTAEHKLVFSAKLKDDGTLAGYVSSDMGDMNWTAERVQ